MMRTFQRDIGRLPKDSRDIAVFPAPGTGATAEEITVSVPIGAWTVTSSTEQRGAFVPIQGVLPGSLRVSHAITNAQFDSRLDHCAGIRPPETAHPQAASLIPGILDAIGSAEQRGP